MQEGVISRKPEPKASRKKKDGSKLKTLTKLELMQK